jgi:hypothetical protein
MATQPTISSVEDLQKELCKAVWKDESLRKEVIADPRATIEKLFNIKLANDLKIRVIDQTEDNVVYLVLPHHPSNIFGFELTEEQLEKVAGGVGNIVYIAGGSTPEEQLGPRASGLGTLGTITGGSRQG